MGWGKGKYTGKGMDKGVFVPLFVQKGNARQDSHAKLHFPWKSYLPQKMLRTPRSIRLIGFGTVGGGPGSAGPERSGRSECPGRPERSGGSERSDHTQGCDRSKVIPGTSSRRAKRTEEFP